MAGPALSLWEDLDPSGRPTAHWVVPPASKAIVLLLGAFDPPTNAHLRIVRAAARAEEASGALCLTKTLLARPPDELLPPARRLALLDVLARESDLGLAIANRGTYLEVAGALR